MRCMSHQSSARTIVCERIHHAQGHLEGVFTGQEDDCSTARHKLLVIVVKKLHQIAAQSCSRRARSVQIYLHLRKSH